MGVNRRGSGSGREPRRAWYPSGPWIDGIKPYDDSRPDTAKEAKPKEAKPKEAKPTGNPDPNNYQLIKAEEKNGYLVVMIKYPDCTNYEGVKILVFRGLTLLQLVNQKLIDPHFFPNDKKYTSPVARFVPTDEGWNMALALVEVLTKDK